MQDEDALNAAAEAEASGTKLEEREYNNEFVYLMYASNNN